MKNFLPMAGIIAILFAGAGCSNENANNAVNEPSGSSSTERVSPNFGKNPCTVVTADEVASAIGKPDSNSERTFTDDESDACNWEGSDDGAMSISFVKSAPRSAPDNPDSARLSATLGRQASVLRSGPTSCTTYIEFSDYRTLLFTANPVSKEPPANAPSTHTACDSFVPLIKTVIERTGWT